MAFLGWVLGCTAVYSALFGVGSLLYGRTPQGLIFMAVFALSSWWLAKLLPAMWGGTGQAE